ncbi:Protein of unknown function [Gryllus bimaculatus]|nr:Protein of unknown function [Gryllus bimaculatus]
MKVARDRGDCSAKSPWAGGVACASRGGSRKSDLAQVNVPFPGSKAAAPFRKSQERQYFLKYHIARKLANEVNVSRHEDKHIRLGHYTDLVDVPEVLHDKYKKMEFLTEISDILYEWVKQENQLNTDEMAQIAVHGMVCRPPPGNCASLNNPGTNCCM